MAKSGFVQILDTMKITQSALFAALLSASVSAWSPSSTRLQMAATLDAPPAREAPGAGWEPEWEDRPGKSPEEFMRSDMSKPDLAGMWECPLTRWSSEGIDVKAAQKEAAKMPHCPLELRASDADNAMGVEYFSKNKDQIRSDLLKYGAVWLRGFNLMQDVQGYRSMYEALGLDPCLDPLHSSGLRKFASERDALYEEVRVGCGVGLW